MPEGSDYLSGRLLQATSNNLNAQYDWQSMHKDILKFCGSLLLMPGSKNTQVYCTSPGQKASHSQEVVPPAGGHSGPSAPLRRHAVLIYHHQPDVLLFGGSANASGECGVLR